MFSFLGRLPCQFSVAWHRPLYFRPIADAILLLASVCLVTVSVPVSAAVPLSIEEAENIALAEEPGQQVFIAQAAALKDESVAAGQLPDPMLRFGVANFPIESGNFSTEGMTQAQLGIRQVFPPGGVLSMRTSQFESLAREMEETADGRLRDVRTAVKTSWLEVFYWNRARSVVTDTRPFFGDLVTVTRSLYSVGRKSQHDVLSAELELSRLDDRLINVNKQLALARAALSEWVGVDAQRPLTGELPEFRDLPRYSELAKRLPEHPMLKAADARVEANRAGVGVARENYKSAWTVDLGYGFRDGSLPNGDPRSDFVSLMVSFDLPVFRSNRKDRELSAAVSQRRAADVSRKELYRRVLSQLEYEYARYQALSERILLFEEQIITQAEARSQSALAAYQSEAGDFADVMRGQIQALDARLEHYRLQVDRAQSYAVLANLGGINP